MDIWDYAELISERLRIWSAVSILAGLVVALRRDSFWRGLGAQFLAWGAVDAAIAIGGQRMINRRYTDLDDPYTPAILTEETAGLRRLLLVNGGLDVLYMLGGLWLARTKGAGSRFWRGSGLGIFVQGAFLFIFDLLHAAGLPAVDR